MAGTPLIAIFPAPPRPPASGQWDASYGNELDRWLRNMTDILSGFTYGRFSGMQFVGPTSGYGLKPGEVFANDGVLTVVQPDDIWAGSFAVTTGLGTLTVSV